MNKLLFLYALLAALGISGFLSNCGGNSGKPTTSNIAPSPGLLLIPATVTSGATAYALAAEVASTAQQQATGLMNRESLGENEAMLFVYTDEETRAFWMKDTLIPLDMIFIGADKKIVDINSNATPKSTVPYISKASAKYVLEVNGGWCNARNIQTGDAVAFAGY